MKGPLTGLNNKLSDILLTVKERPKLVDNELLIGAVKSKINLNLEKLPSLKLNRQPTMAGSKS